MTVLYYCFSFLQSSPRKIPVAPPPTLVCLFYIYIYIYLVWINKLRSFSPIPVVLKNSEYFFL